MNRFRYFTAETLIHSELESTKYLKVCAMRVRTRFAYNKPSHSGNHISLDQFSRSHNFIDHFIISFICAQIDRVQSVRIAV